MGLCWTLTSPQLRKLWGRGQPALRDRLWDRLRSARRPPPGRWLVARRGLPCQVHGAETQPHARCLQKQILACPVSPARLRRRRALLPLRVLQSISCWLLWQRDTAHEKPSPSTDQHTHTSASTEQTASDTRPEWGLASQRDLGLDKYFCEI